MNQLDLFDTLNFSMVFLLSILIVGNIFPTIFPVRQRLIKNNEMGNLIIF